MRISLHGSYFGNNYGDVLLMKLFTQWIREYDPLVMINYPRIKSGVILDLPENTTRGLWNLLRSDALVFFGGGYFGEQPTHKLKWSFRNFHRHAIVAFLAIVFRIPYAIIGVEFGPLSVSWFRKCVVFIAKKADCLIVRNQESMDFLEKHGVTNAKLSYDAVLSLSDFIKPKTDNCSNKMLLHLTKINDNTLTLIEAIIKVLKEQKITKVGFIEDELGQYSRFKSNQIFDLFENANIKTELYKYEGTDKIIEIINDSEMIVTTKLHIGITGIALNKKVFSVYMHPKTLRFHKQVNNQKNCMALNEIDKSVYKRLREFMTSEKYTIPKFALDKAKGNKKVLFDFLRNL